MGRIRDRGPERYSRGLSPCARTRGRCWELPDGGRERISSGAARIAREQQSAVHWVTTLKEGALPCIACHGVGQLHQPPQGRVPNSQSSQSDAPRLDPLVRQTERLD